MDRANPEKKAKKSKVCLCIQVILLLMILSLFSIALIYHFGTEELHKDIPHALDEIFGTKNHLDLITKLNKKAYKHSIIWGQPNTGIFSFLQHYADTRASNGGLVVLKRIENNFLETALKFIRYTKQYIEQNFNLQGQLEKVQWIYIVKDGQFPLDQIQRIISKRPKDRVVVGVTTKPQKVKGFKAIEFPQVSLDLVKKVIQTQFDVTQKQATLLVNFYGTVPEILEHLNQISYTHEKHLGPYYQNIQDLSQGQLKTLANLCQNGNAVLQGNEATLQQIGVVTYENQVYWQQRKNRLNYQLSKQIQCVDSVVPQEIKKLIALKRQEDSKAELQEQKDAQQDEEEQKPKKKKSNKAVSKKGTGKNKGKTNSNKGNKKKNIDQEL